MEGDEVQLESSLEILALVESMEQEGTKKMKNIDRELRPEVEAPVLTLENPERLEGRDPLAAALATVVTRSDKSSLPPSVTGPDPTHARLAMAKGKAWRKGKGKEMGGTITTRGEGFEMLYGEDIASVHTLELFADWESRATTPSLNRTPESVGVSPEPVCVQRCFLQRDVAPKLGLDETVELLTRVLSACEEDLDLSAFSAAPKTKLGLSNVKKPPSTMSPGVELLTRDVKSRRGIRSSLMDTCPSPFHLRVRTLPVCNVGDTSEAEMKSYGRAAQAPLAITHPSPPSGGTGDTSVPSRGTKAIASANLQIELPKFDPKNLPEWDEEFSEFLLLTGQQHTATS